MVTYQHKKYVSFLRQLSVYNVLNIATFVCTLCIYKNTQNAYSSCHLASGVFIVHLNKCYFYNSALIIYILYLVFAVYEVITLTCSYFQSMKLRPMEFKCCDLCHPIHDRPEFKK